MAMTRSNASLAVEHVCHRLRSYGILTERSLTELLHPLIWKHEGMHRILDEAQRAGRVRHLGGGVYDLTDAERGR